MRTPKLHGFKNRFRVEYAPLNLGRLADAAAGTLITPDVLRHDELLRDQKTRPMPVKILGGGDAPRGVTIHAHAFTRSALAKLAAAGQHRPADQLAGRRADRVRAGRGAVIGRAESQGARKKAKAGGEGRRRAEVADARRWMAEPLPREARGIGRRRTRERPTPRPSPDVIESLVQAFRAPDIRRKILFTLGILLIFRALTNVPVPNVNQAQLANLFTPTSCSACSTSSRAVAWRPPRSSGWG